MGADFDRRKFLTAGALAMAWRSNLFGATPSSTPASRRYVRPGDPDYDTRRAGYNLRMDKRPAYIAVCTDTAQVADAVRFAAKENLPVAVKSGGHSFEAFSVNDGGVVVDVSGMNRITRPDDTTLRVGPGCRLGEIYDATFPHGRLLPAGSCAGVGIAGLALGGGYGLFSRRFGLTCDHLLEVEMVDGSGALRSSRNDPDLLKACRGGGNGNFGVITGMTFRTQPAPTLLRSHRFKTAGLDAPRAAKLLERWFVIAEKLPPECFSAFVLNGSSLLILLTDTAETPHEDAVAAFRALGGKYSKSEKTAVADAVRNYYGRSDPLWFKNASAGFLRGFADTAPVIEAALGKVIATRGMIYQVNTLGGKIADPEAAANSCYAHRDKPFLAELQAYPIKSADRAQTLLRFAEIQALFRSAGISAHYANYPDLGFKEPLVSYYGDRLSFLKKIKARYDPDNRIRHAQSVKA